MIIGVTGTLGSGKGTVSEYLVKEKGFVQFAVSDTFLAGEAIRRGLQPNRQARHDIANEYRAQGPMKLMEACYEFASRAIAEGKDVIIDPQHTPDEVRFIQEKGGFVIAVNADIAIRYERIKKRGGAKDNVSFEEFKRMDDLEASPTATSNNNLLGALEAADVLLTNDGSLEDFHTQIDAALAKLGA